MPTPPTYFLDFVSVGAVPFTDLGWRQTWGKTRAPITIAATVQDIGLYNATYDVGFAAEDHGPLFIDFYAGTFSGPSKFLYTDFPPPVSPPFGWFSIQDVRLLRDSYENQLVGETVGMSGGSFVMNGDAWSNFPFDGNQEVSHGLGTFTSCGKLYKF
jgi:hypothetical protein